MKKRARTETDRRFPRCDFSRFVSKATRTNNTQGRTRRRMGFSALKRGPFDSYRRDCIKRRIHVIAKMIKITFRRAPENRIYREPKIICQMSASHSTEHDTRKSRSVGWLENGRGLSFESQKVHAILRENLGCARYTRVENAGNAHSTSLSLQCTCVLVYVNRTHPTYVSTHNSPLGRNNDRDVTPDKGTWYTREPAFSASRRLWRQVGFNGRSL